MCHFVHMLQNLILHYGQDLKSATIRVSLESNATIWNIPLFYDMIDVFVIHVFFSSSLTLSMMVHQVTIVRKQQSLAGD